MIKRTLLLFTSCLPLLGLCWLVLPDRAQVNSNPSGGSLFPNAGTTNLLSKFISPSQLGNSIISSSGSNIVISNTLTGGTGGGFLTVGGQNTNDIGTLTIGGGGANGNFSLGPGSTFTSSGPGGVMVGVIASGTGLAMTTAAITAGNCGTTVTASAANVLAATDSIKFSFNAAPAGTNAGLVSWPTNGNVNFAYCPGVAETPAAASINWEVVR